MSKLSRSELANLAVGLPIVTAIVGVLVGLGLGIGIGWVVKPSAAAVQPGANVAVDAFSADQIQFKCGQIRGEELKSANERISALERERDEYEQKVLALERQVEQQRGSSGGPGGGSGSGGGQIKAAELEGKLLDLQRELNSARDQLGEVTRQLYQAEEDKRQLQDALVATSNKLRATESALAFQTSKTDAAKEDALGQRWWRFIADSQLEICEKGNRKKLGACREVVQAHLKSNAVRDKFVHCVRSEQAVPSVGFLEKEASMPRFAQFIDQDDRIVRDWYIQMCDPTLPEAVGLQGDAPAPSLGPGNPLALDDLDP